uniref:Ankyrin repeat protein n=1 Tax=Mimivirus LCMiAC02 TaxID=2506609 RepID=A0A481Z1T1_9VIRU|nr:MAG: ankyrin repeat protein [Mimivirus LCMiAC02]
MEHNRILFDLIKKHKWDDFSNYLKNNEDIDVNIRDNSNNYLIHYAIIYNHKNTVSMLIHRGSRLDITDSNGRSILYIPIKHNYVDILSLLLYFNKTNIGISLVDIVDKNNNIPLHYAINTKSIKIIKMLLDAGSDVNTTDSRNYNALQLAVYSKNIEIVNLIIKSNIKFNINNKGKTGESALHIACNFQLDDIVQLLIKHNINVNIQDYDNEFTALHYSVNLNNIKITNILLKGGNKAKPLTYEHSDKGANVNIQDFMGNTAIHYAIIELNYNILGILLNSKYTKNIINLNLYNIDSKLPIHLLLEQSIKGLKSLKGPKSPNNSYMSTMLKLSNLNFRDNRGYTPMHHISSNNIWKKYVSLLKTKKINIFAINKLEKRPIDYVNKTDIDSYINMATHSYLYVLRNYSHMWKESWENLCKMELFKNKLTKEQFKILSKYIDIDNIKNIKNIKNSVVSKKKTKSNTNKDICFHIVKNKLLEIYNSKIDKCEYTSHPSKKNKKCIIITHGSKVEQCTFTGITLDVLVGLIFLLKKHSTACSTLTKNFVKNKKLCNYYKSIGINTNTKCEFLNFEIVWIYQKLYISDDFIDEFNKCVDNKKKKFVIIPLGIELRHGGHANYLIYDINANEIERFEPYGSSGPFQFDYNPDLLDEILKYKFSKINPKIKYIKPSDYMPKIGLQYFDVTETTKKKIGDPGGFCALWNIWYTDMRLTYSSINRKALVKKMIKSIKKQNISFKDMIRNYSKNVTDIRDNLFNKVDITINDWLNDQYTEKQVIVIIKELTDMIEKYTA